MFLQASVILSTGGGCLPKCMLGYHHIPLGADTPPEQTPPGADPPPEQTTPRADTPPPRADTPPGADKPPGADNPPPRADTPPRYRVHVRKLQTDHDKDVTLQCYNNNLNVNTPSVSLRLNPLECIVTLENGWGRGTDFQASQCIPMVAI